MGIIGYGGMAAGYHHGTTKREDVAMRSVAAYDINPARVDEARKNGLIGFDCVKDFLASGLFDFVLVATPNNFHCEMACKALEAGYNVMVEKPVAMNSGELETMINTAEKCGKLFTVHQNRRWDRDFMIAKQLIEEGAIGKPIVIESRLHSSPASGGTMTGWRGYKDHGGGMFLDWGVHMMDQILYMIQEPVKSVAAVVRNIVNDEVDDYAKVIITFQSGLAAQVEVATFTPICLPRWYAIGDKGAMTIDNISSPKAKIRRIKEDIWEEGSSAAYTSNGMEIRPQKHHKPTFEDAELPDTPPPQDWASLYQNVTAALDGTQELIVKPAQVLRCFKVMEAALISSKIGKSVEF